MTDSILTVEDLEIRVILMSVRMGKMTKVKLLEKCPHLAPYLDGLMRSGLIEERANGELFITKRE
jgi:hypothetical protein